MTPLRGLNGICSEIESEIAKPLSPNDMSRVYSSIIVMILLFLGAVPMNVDAEVGGRYATFIDLSPDEVGTGGYPPQQQF